MKRSCYVLVYLIGCTSVVIIGYSLILHHIEGDNKVTTTNNQQTASQLATRPIEKPRITNVGLGINGNLAPVTNILLEKYNEFDVKSRLLREKIQRLTANSFIGKNEDEVEEQHRYHQQQHEDDEEQQQQHHHHHHYTITSQRNVSTKNIHIFYNAPVNWYQATNTTHLRDADGATESNQIEVNTLNSMFYPMLGIYTISTKILETHFRNIQQMGIEVIIFTWNTEKSIELLKHILNYVKKYYAAGKLTVAIEIDVYAGRTADTIRNAFELFHREFIWSHPALYRVFVASQDKYLPMIYIRESWQISDTDWLTIFSPKGSNTVRKTIYDGIFIGHVR